MGTRMLWAIPAAVAFAARSATACPYCDSDVGKQVSAGIFNGDFWTNALLTLLPLPLTLLIVALIHFGFPGRQRRAQPGRNRPQDADSLLNRTTEDNA